MPPRGGAWERAQLEGTPGSEGLPHPRVLGPPWSRRVRKGGLVGVPTCFIMASVASILGADGKGTTKS